MTPEIQNHLRDGQAIPALPLALSTRRRWDEKHQRALIRYYIDAGAGGLAVGVHSTQFEIREPQHDLFRPLLEFASREIDAWLPSGRLQIKISGLCGRTKQAADEAVLARNYGFHAGLLSLGAWQGAPEAEILAHCRIVAQELPLIGFYLQPAAGGRVFSHHFWREFATITELVAIKIAPFNRYQTIDVVRAIMDVGRDDVALYTGNDDNIIVDLLTPFEFAGRTRHIAGGLLGQWGVWTERAVALLAEIKKARKRKTIDAAWLTKAIALTDANAAVFDPANGFAGCLPGIHEILRRQGLLATTACLDRSITLSPGQADELTRVSREHAWLCDDDFVAANLARWLG